MTKTLEHRIREKARAKLKDDIKSAIDPLIKYTEYGMATDLSLNDKPASISTVIEEMKKTFFNFHIIKAEERAIEDFMKKVDSLQDQIDELRDSQS